VRVPALSSERAARRDAIRSAMEHAFGGYAKHAWGYDELRPVSGVGVNNFHPPSGIGGLTIVDALDTLIIMGLDNFVNASLAWIESSLNVTEVGDVGTFETVIRIVGGLMSAYHLTGNPLLLRKAEHVALPLARCFTRTEGAPYPNVNMRMGTCSWNPWRSSVPAAVNLMVEWRALATSSENPIFAEALHAQENFVARLQDASVAAGMGGMIASEVREDGFQKPGSGQATTIGSPADSYYEYLLKSFAQGNFTDLRWRGYWLQVVDSVVDKMAVKVPNVGQGDLVVTHETLLGHISRPSHNVYPANAQFKMDHFSWYVETSDFLVFLIQSRWQRLTCFCCCFALLILVEPAAGYLALYISLSVFPTSTWSSLASVATATMKQHME
jgi:Glycosyl hydrolase family 47